MASRAARLLHLRAGEGAPIALLFGWYFCVIGAAFIARAVRDSLFLAHLSADRLPIMYIASPLALTVVGLVYARVEGRIRRDRLAIGTLVISGAAMLAARLAIGAGDWIFYALYIAVNVMSGLVIMQLWTVASDRFTSRDAKRVFGLIGAGGTVADIAVGAALSVLAPRIGAEDMLYLCAGLLFTAAAFAVALRSRGRGFGDARPRAKVTGVEPRPPGASHLTLVGAALVCSVLVVTLVEFQFKAVTAATFGADRAGMVRYFGNMSIATGIVSLAIQLTATRWVVERLGVAGALLVLPVGLAAGEVGLLLVPGVIAATVLKMSDETFRFTVNDAASQLLFLPVPSRARGRWKAIVDNAWKPGAQLGLGLLLLGYRAIAPGRIGPLVGFAFCAIAVWLVVIGKLRGAYVTALRETLRQRPAALDSPTISREEATVIAAALTGDDPAQVLAALELARPIAADLRDKIAPLVDHADPRVRALACELLGPDPRLRAHLDDPDAGVRSAALGALLGGDDADAARRLELLARSDAPEDRIRSARAVAASTSGARTASSGERTGMSGARTMSSGERTGMSEARTKLLATLIGDRDLSVARAAVEAAVIAAHPSLVAPLLARLATLDVAPALAACGDEARIIAALEHAEPRARRELIRALGLLATPAAAEALVIACEHDDPHAPRALARAASRGVAFDRMRVRAVIDREIASAFRAMAAAEGLGHVESAMVADGTRARVPYLPDAPEGAAALLSKTLRDRQERHRDRMFALLAALSPGAGIETIAANLREPDAARRANAIEVLDSLVDRELRARVVTLVDESPRYAKLAAVPLELPKLTREEWVADLLADPAPWVVACTAYYAGVHRIGAVQARLRELAHHADATVREAATLAASYQ